MLSCAVIALVLVLRCRCDRCEDDRLCSRPTGLHGMTVTVRGRGSGRVDRGRLPVAAVFGLRRRSAMKDVWSRSGLRCAKSSGHANSESTSGQERDAARHKHIS